MTDVNEKDTLCIKCTISSNMTTYAASQRTLQVPVEMNPLILLFVDAVLSYLRDGKIVYLDFTFGEHDYYRGCVCDIRVVEAGQIQLILDNDDVYTVNEEHVPLMRHTLCGCSFEDREPIDVIMYSINTDANRVDFDLRCVANFIFKCDFYPNEMKADFMNQLARSLRKRTNSLLRENVRLKESVAVMLDQIATIYRSGDQFNPRFLYISLNRLNQIEIHLRDDNIIPIDGMGYGYVRDMFRDLHYTEMIAVPTQA